MLLFDSMLTRWGFFAAHFIADALGKAQQVDLEERGLIHAGISLARIQNLPVCNRPSHSFVTRFQRSDRRKGIGKHLRRIS